ncbi:MAG: hypothetical protein U0R44_00570 [Candidatus Micrarchaeia archaeon]
MNNSDRKLGGKYRIRELYDEIGKLRARDNLEPIGGLGFAHKVWSHFHEAPNPRVMEAMANLDQRMNDSKGKSPSIVTD